MKLSDFTFDLPKSSIAQTPANPREDAKLLCYNKEVNKIDHNIISDLVELLWKNDVLVFNKSRVIPARIKFWSNKKYEILLSKPITNPQTKDKNSHYCWEVMVRLWKKNKIWDKHQIDDEIWFEILDITENWTRIVNFYSINVCNDKLSNNTNFNFMQWLQKTWETPLPPYIDSSSAPNENDKASRKNKSSDKDYQTSFSKIWDWLSVAAPTAGLHFTKDLLSDLKEKWVQIEFVHLDVWLWTFLPVKTENIKDHKIHFESYSIDKSSAERLNKAKNEWKNIIAVWTTSIRVLETVANKYWKLRQDSWETNIFITPWYKWKFVNSIISNFHLPGSTLIMLISSFIWREKTLELYEKAIKKWYRFYSFGDAMYLK